MSKKAVTSGEEETTELETDATASESATTDETKVEESVVDGDEPEEGAETNAGTDDGDDSAGDAGDTGAGETEGEKAEDDDAEEEEVEDEVLVSIGEEAPPPVEQTRAPAWVRELRKSNREIARENRELKARLDAQQRTETKPPVTLGAKPKLEEHDYDTDKFETALSDWYERKRAADLEAEKAQAQVKAQEDAWKATLEGYGKAKAALKVRDFEDAEAAAQQFLDVTQQGILVQGAENPALVIYALGKNPKKLKELSSIKDPVKYAFAVAKLEKELKVTKRKAAPPPERVVTGTGPASGSIDSTLERLRADAAKTGDFSKVHKYKQDKKSAAKK